MTRLARLVRCSSQCQQSELSKPGNLSKLTPLTQFLRISSKCFKVHFQEKNISAQLSNSISSIFVRPFGSNVCANTTSAHLYFPYLDKVVLMTYFDRGS